jgi:uncharacterized membrane protein YbaN (DUF454 family)
MYSCGLNFVQVTNFGKNSIQCKRWGSVGSRLWTGQLRNHGSIPARGKIFFSSSKMSKQALGTTQPPVQWVLGALILGTVAGLWSWPAVLHLVQNWRLDRAVHIISKYALLSYIGTVLLFYFTLFNLQVSYSQNIFLTSWLAISHGDWPVTL